MTTPTISVVMSVYNGADHLKEAVDSILGQSFRDFEFIIINDGSTDETTKILTSYKDKRIKIIEQKNRGLVASLNRGIRLSSGEWIARQDADDRSEPDRLAKQLRFLAHHPKVVLLGTSMAVMSQDSKVSHHHAVLLHDPELRQELLVRSPFAHGSVLFRRDTALESGLYSRDYWPAEDYEFWLRLSAHGQLANLDEYLYVYRENETGISAKYAAQQAKQVVAIQKAAWQVRQRLISSAKIGIKSYNKLDMGDLRKLRIIDNVLEAGTLAMRQKDLGTARSLVGLLRGHPLIAAKAWARISRGASA